MDKSKALCLLGLVSLCGLTQLFCTAKADPWDEHRECFTRYTWRGPVLFCEEERRERPWGWDHDWHASRWQSEQNYWSPQAVQYVPVQPVVRISAPISNGHGLVTGEYRY
jgi:hypothetical protein